MEHHRISGSYHRPSQNGGSSGVERKTHKKELLETRHNDNKPWKPNDGVFKGRG